MSNTKKIISRVSLIVGILVFGYIIYSIGPVKIWKHITEISLINFLVLMGFRLLYFILRNINWKIILDRYEKNVSWWDLFVARMCSHSISQLFPSAQVGGEVARIYMIRTSDPKISIASVIVDKTLEYLSILIFTVFAVGYMFLRFDIPPKWKYLFLLFGFSLGLLVGLIIVKQK